MVVDFGTATTFDIVDKNGAYAGGVIAPGINLSLEALYMAAAKLPNVAIEKPKQVIGKSTVPAMQSGVFWGYVGLIEGIIGRIRGECAGALKVVATGGLAPLFAEGTPVIEITGVARNRVLSQRIADRTARELRAYVDRIQNQEKLKPDQRIQLTVLNRAAGTKGLLVTPRSKTLPIVGSSLRGTPRRPCFSA